VFGKSLADTQQRLVVTVPPESVHAFSNFSSFVLGFFSVIIFTTGFNMYLSPAFIILNTLSCFCQ